jgi:hypothetical protein
MSQTSQLAARGAVAAASRAVVWVFFALALAAGLFSLAFGTAGVITSLVEGTTPLTMPLDQPLRADPASSSAAIVSGSDDSASIVVSGLDSGMVLLATIARVAGILTQVAVAAVIALTAWRLLRGRAFRRSLTLTVAFSGAILLVDGVSIGGPWPMIGSVDGTPIGIGVCLLLVGLAFEYGERPQSDTEGLV